MCLACEMAVRWFANMEEAARPAVATPDHIPANAEVTAADGAPCNPQNPKPAADSASRNAAQERTFVCEPTSGEGE